MPALVLFGRRWLCAGDDLVIPALQLSIFHLTWTVVLSVWLGEARRVIDCPEKRYYEATVSSLLGTCAISTILEPVIAYISSRGAMFETRKRSGLTHVVYADLCMSALRVVATIYGTITLYKHSNECLKYPSGSSFSLVSSYEAALWCMWIMIGSLAAFSLLAFNFFPNYKDPEVWKKQFVYISYWFCCISGTRDEVDGAFRRLGEFVGDLLGHTDLTVTDVLVIFYLGRMRQRMFLHDDIVVKGDDDEDSTQMNDAESGRFVLKAKSSRRLERIGSRASLDIDNEGLVEQSSVQEAAYYMKYAFAAYGWMLYVWAKPGTGLVKLCCSGLIPNMLRAKHGLPINFRKSPYLNRQAIMLVSELEPPDILFVRLEGENKDVLPYFIGLDHKERKLIISIRGSMSFDDVVRDLKYDPVDVDDWICAYDTPPDLEEMHRDDTGFTGHRGIVEAAQATMKDIKSTGVLRKHLLDPDAPHREYGVVVCGHSLGAGCAFFAGLHLRSIFPNLRCFAYSPPGGLVSIDLASSCKDWCISTVCGKEVIPRLTLGTLERLRDDLVLLGMSSKMSKIQILISMMTRYMWSDPDLFYTEENLPEEQQEWLHAYEESIHAPSNVRDILKRARSFAPPGKIMYFKPTGKVRKHRRLRGKLSREYVCTWSNPASLIDKGIIVSGRMMKDHMPDYSYALLQKLGGLSLRKRKSVYIADEVVSSVIEDVQTSQ
mmetsp:Transcript_4881/g.9741  ORF Transcript_4881/g.9741 Transcript_4881/m.9741 type:complete len:716 (+) Transcript_4881:157-2304(+)|eukprot:CAMPEP_0118804122 /NCGR_PEP_ID=MMETSP1161-20130426/21029_1 /TAXON_ID=249345 /ORGANISM="Picochlorum oklahomensis, Strain CCMP2329" /LENGTH=715 /DNA_ID=CAMNT_0006732791 /DNA_START=155 /DNA_END=2302 /DNA_ORIENTATION=-